MKTEDIIRALKGIQNKVRDMDSYNRSLFHDWESKVDKAEWFCAVLDTEIDNLVQSIEKDSDTNDKT